MRFRLAILATALLSLVMGCTDPEQPKEEAAKDAAAKKSEDKAQTKEKAKSDVEKWNEAVDSYNKAMASYKKGDVTNALCEVTNTLYKMRGLLRPKSSYRVRAADVVAELEYKMGNREEAANAAQIVLRAKPDDSRVNRNFTRAIDGLPELREKKHEEAVRKAAEGKDHGAMLLAATKDCRAIMAEAAGYRTNRAEKAVAIANALEKRAKKLSDKWIVVRDLIVQSATNEEQAATIPKQIDAARKNTKDAARKLGDLDPEGYSLIADAEHDFTRFVKLTVAPPAAMDEDLIAQSNAWLDVEQFNGRSWQQDALDYTRAFRERFPEWARAYEQQAQSDTNKPPFTVEDQAKISGLAADLEKLQMECVEKSLPPNQEEALRIINEIRELLPKDPNGGQQQQQQDQQQKNDQNQQQNQQTQQDQQQQQQDQQQDQGEDEDKDNGENKDKPDEGEQQDAEDQEVEAVLKKAQERSDEHEEEKKAHMKKAPLPPDERDW